MPQYVPTSRTWVNAVIVALAMYTSVQAESVTVTVSSGRKFTGEVDRRSDDRSLWLRFESGESEMLRPIGWHAVRTIKAGDRVLSIETFRREIDQWKSSRPGTKTRQNSPQPLPLPAPAQNGSELLPVTATVPIANDRARSIQLDVRVANWDNDVEMDGLVVSVVAVDGWGQAVPVDGTLEVELFGEGPGSVVQRQTFPTLGRWVRKVRHDEPATFQLPFQAVHPEFDLKFGAVGLVHARLVAPGQGAFEITSDTTVLRPSNPMRDRLQSIDDQRFFHTERTGRGKQQVPQTGGI